MLNKERIKLRVAQLLMRLFSLLPINKNKIVYSSYRGSYFNDNPHAIFEAIKSKRKGLVHVWLLNSPVHEYHGLQCRYHSLRAIYEMATSAIWIDNCRKETWVHKRKKQKYVQTWHAGVSIKKVESDAIEKLPEHYDKMAIRDSSMTDLYISPAKWCSKLYSSSFWYNGEILESGYPRSDILFDVQKHRMVIDEVKSFYGISGCSIALYAPTFRSDSSTECYNIDYVQLVNKLESVFGGQWKVLVRLHPNIKNKQTNLNYNTFTLDGSKYEDINRLIVACDLFITDYSSCIFDAMEIGKKIILYAKDIDNYNSERGVYFSLYDLPFPLAQSNEDLIHILENYNGYCDVKRIEEFKKELGIYRVPNASEIVADYILGMLGNYE